MEKNIIRAIFTQSAQVKLDIAKNENLLEEISKTTDIIVSAYRRKNKVLIAGNGGSAADAQHIAAEFVSRFMYDRPALPAIALHTNTSSLTAIGNDYGYEDSFSRTLEAFAQDGDVFLAISTSGNSPNILSGLNAAKKLNLFCIGLAGKTGGKMKEMCDICVCVPSISTPRIQESHITIAHIVCEFVEKELFPKE